MSEKYLELDRGICSKLAYCLYQQKKQRLFCDIKINIGSVACVHLHSCVLAAFSPCLDVLISKCYHNGEKSPEESAENNGKWSFRHPLEITLTPEHNDASELECEKCAVEFFDFLYIGKIKIKPGHVLHMEYLSSILQVEDLLDACKSFRTEIDPSGKLVCNEIKVIDKSNQRNAEFSKRNSQHSEKTFAEIRKTYFRNKMRKLITDKNNKLIMHEEKILISDQEMNLCSQKSAKEVSGNLSGKFINSQTALNNGTDFGVKRCNLLNDMKTVEKQKCIAQSASFPKHREHKFIREVNNGSSIEKQICNLKEKDTVVHENLLKKMVNNESNLVYELHKTSSQNKTDIRGNQPEKQDIDIIDLTQPSNISEITERKLNTLEKNTSVIHDERVTTQPEENDTALLSEIDSDPLRAKVISNNNKELLQLSATAAKTNDSSCISTVEKGHCCVCCDFFAKCHYDLLKHMLLSNHKEKTCSLCLFEADSWKILSDHILLHNDPQPFFCSFCSQRFKTLNAVNEHTSKHTGMDPYSCPVCSDLFKSKCELQKHMTGHKDGETFTCNKCHFCATDKKEFSSHSLILSDSLFECSQPNCSYKTYLQCSLKDHSIQHSIPNYLCELCGDSFLKTEDLQEHVVKHEENFCIFQCSKLNCAFRTNIESSFKAHCRQHASEKSHLCKLCGDIFSSPEFLQDHVKKHEENMSVFKYFKSTNALQTILRAYQSSYLCKVCGTKFSKIDDAQQHALEHLIKVPHFSCPICQFRAKNINSLEQHLLKSHPALECEIKESTEPAAKRNSIVPRIIRNRIFTSPKVPVKFDSKSSNVKYYAVDKLESNAKTIPTEVVILPSTISGEHLKNSMKHKVKMLDIAKDQSFLDKDTTNVQNSFSLVLNPNSVTNLTDVSLLSPAASLFKGEYQITKTGKRMKIVKILKTDKRLKTVSP